MIDKKTRNIILKETNNRGTTKSFTEEEIENAMLNTTTYNTEEAQNHVLIDRIELPKLKTDYYIIDQYLATLK